MRRLAVVVCLVSCVVFSATDRLNDLSRAEEHCIGTPSNNNLFAAIQDCGPSLYNPIFGNIEARHSRFQDCVKSKHAALNTQIGTKRVMDCLDKLTRNERGASAAQKGRQAGQKGGTKRGRWGG